MDLFGMDSGRNYSIFPRKHNKNLETIEQFRPESIPNNSIIRAQVRLIKLAI